MFSQTHSASDTAEGWPPIREDMRFHRGQGCRVDANGPQARVPRFQEVLLAPSRPALGRVALQTTTSCARRRRAGIHVQRPPSHWIAMRYVPSRAVAAEQHTKTPTIIRTRARIPTAMPTMAATVSPCHASPPSAKKTEEPDANDTANVVHWPLMSTELRIVTGTTAPLLPLATE